MTNIFFIINDLIISTLKEKYKNGGIKKMRKSLQI